MIMKKYLLYSIIALTTFSSCKKSWLEIVPQGNQILVTTDDYDKVMNDPGLYNFSTGGLADAQLMGDEIAAEANFFASLDPVHDFRERYFRWSDSIFAKADQSPYQLSKHLSQVYQHNTVISDVLSSQGGTDQQKRALRAEALASRAWSYFLMASYYCKPYQSTAGTDPGFPVITSPEVNATTFTRGTVQQTYDFIIKDLTEALVSIPQKQTYVTRMSKPAVEALLGKVYLFMGKYNEALPLLKSALNNVAANGQTTLYDYNLTLASGGSFLPIDPIFSGPVNGPGNSQTDTRESVLFKVFYAGSYSGNQTGNNGLVLTPQTQALYGASDLRLLLYTDNNPDNSDNAAGRIRKYGVTYSRWGMQLPELYLLSAEAKARTNDLAGAVADVETLRRNRMPEADAAVPNAIAANQTALIKFIIEERIREFAMEGYRWFDMRRLSVDPLFAGTVFTHTVYNPSGPNTVYTLKQPERLTLLFPRNFTDANPDFKNNP